MIKVPHRETAGRLASLVSAIYIISAAAFFVLMGLALWLCFFGDTKLLDEVDSMSGLANRTVFAILGGVHVIIGIYLFLGADLTKKGMIMLWVGWVYLILYFLVRLMANDSKPIPLAALTSWELGISLKVLYALWGLVFGYLVVGGTTILIFGWVQSKKLKSEQFIRQWSIARQRKP